MRVPSAVHGWKCRCRTTRLAVHQLERLPVVKDASSRELLGLVARSDLVKPSLALFDEEENFEQFNALES